MPTFPTPTTEAGFTLLELLVVITVLALVSGLLVFRYGGGDAAATFERQVQAVRETLEAARAEAVLRGRLREITVGQLSAVAPRLTISVVSDGDAAPIVFLPDGTASGGVLLLVGETARRKLAIDWLTGRSEIGEP